MKNSESRNEVHKLPSALAENASGLSEDKKAFAVVVGNASAERWRQQHVREASDPDSDVSSGVE